MKKSKNEKKHITLEKVVLIVIIVFVLLTGVLFLSVYLSTLNSDDEIKASDWLMATCSVLSMFGTIFLAYVSFLVSNRANRLNELVIQQNEKLQQINDTQFKIANQKLFPFLYGSTSMIYNSSFSDYIIPTNWKLGCSRTLEEKSKVYIDIDARWDKNKEAKLKATTLCTLWNKSSVIISKIEIYKIAINNPFNNIHSVNWVLTDSILKIEQSICIYFNFFHDNDKFIPNGDSLSFSFFLKMETITGVSFYEKIYVRSMPGSGICDIDKISMDKITN